jgi:hypothetical protein
MAVASYLAGIALNLVLVWLGLVWAVPQFGVFGYAWTLVMVVITLVNLGNLMRLLRARRRSRETGDG